MKLFRKIAILFVLVCFSSVVALAQSAVCSDLVQRALSAVGDSCAPTGRNEACYGYVSLEATAREGAQDFSFTHAGDLANVADLQTLRLSALDTANNTWGIALMKLQANLPDALPGENVTFLLFGDVQIDNAVADTPALATLEATANGNSNVRSGPGTSYQVAGSLTKNDTLTVNGRNQDGSWLRIQIPDSNSLGWVRADLITVTGDVTSLSVVDAADLEVPYTPMQAFYFRTGITQTTCADAPQDGILIQTPEGVGQINVRANDVDIQLGSTAYLQALPGDHMTVSVVEGQGQITAEGKTVTVPAGAQVDIPIDADMKASGIPGDPQALRRRAGRAAADPGASARDYHRAADQSGRSPHTDTERQRTEQRRLPRRFRPISVHRYKSGGVLRSDITGIRTGGHDRQPICCANAAGRGLHSRQSARRVRPVPANAPSLPVIAIPVIKGMA